MGDYTDGGVMCSASIYGGNEAQPEIGNCYGAVGQFITVQHSNDYITICEFEAFGDAQDDPNPSIVTTDSATAQSSNGWGSTDGGRAVDGVTGDGSWGSASCT